MSILGENHIHSEVKANTTSDTIIRARANKPYASTRHADGQRIKATEDVLYLPMALLGSRFCEAFEEVADTAADQGITCVGDVLH